MTRHRNARGRGGRPASLARDIARINRSLRSGLDVRIDVDSAAGRSCATARVVLSLRRSDGGVRSVSAPFPFGRHDRRRRIALARSVAECAMLLGLGAGIYRAGTP